MSARMRLGLAATTFMAWIGWLAFLAFTTTRPVILYRPQLLVSRLDVIAEVPAEGEHPANEVTVREVHWPPEQREHLTGHKITVTNLSGLSHEEGWRGPGSYILPLVPNGDNFRVATIPHAPGVDPARIGQPRIYQDTPQARYQLNEIHKID